MFLGSTRNLRRLRRLGANSLIRRRAPSNTRNAPSKHANANESSKTKIRQNSSTRFRRRATYRRLRGRRIIDNHTYERYTHFHSISTRIDAGFPLLSHSVPFTRDSFLTHPRVLLHILRPNYYRTTFISPSKQERPLYRLRHTKSTNHIFQKSSYYFCINLFP